MRPTSLEPSLLESFSFLFTLTHHLANVCFWQGNLEVCLKKFKPITLLGRYLKSHVLTNGLIFIYNGQDLTAICSSFRTVNEEAGSKSTRVFLNWLNHLCLVEVYSSFFFNLPKVRPKGWLIWIFSNMLNPVQIVYYRFKISHCLMSAFLTYNSPRG